MIKVGDVVPEASLYEYLDTEQEGCSLGPNKFTTTVALKDKKIVLFGLPGAFTPTCSERHVPGYVESFDALKKKGVDEIWCVSVNDAFVMGAWGRTMNTAGKVRMMGDGSALFTKACGLEFDLNAGGLGLRCQRFLMIIDKGVVKHLAIEAAGKLEVSSAQAALQVL